MANEFKVKKGLIVEGSGGTVLDVQGSQGQLFSVTDDLTGDLFQVSDISGDPILNVNSSGLTTMEDLQGINATFSGDAVINGGDLSINGPTTTYNSKISLKGYEPYFALIKTRGSSGDDTFKIKHENDTSAVDFTLAQDGGSDVRTARITDNGRWVIGGYAEVNTSQLSVQGSFGATGSATIQGTSSTFNTGNSGTFITNDANNYPRLTMTNASAQLGLFRAGGNAGGMYIGGSGDGFRLYTSSFSQKLFVDTSGNISCYGDIYGKSVDGAYSSLYKFGGIYFTWDSDSYGTNFQHSITSTSNGVYGDNMTWNSYGKIRINFDSNNNDSGDFQIGHHGTGTGTALFTLNSTGTGTFTGDVVAYSDERLKTDIKTLDGSKVYEMRGVSFIKDNKKGSGVIAQELEKVAPELVDEYTEYKSVAYGNITGYLIEAIKELKAEIEELKSNKCNCNK